MTKATFAAGCFWGVEAAFRQLDGVVSTAVGYMGGTTENPTYQDVCSSTTGHAEVAQVEFDPARISYEELLQTFWKIHNPTTRNRQGPDVGTQYRSAVFFHDPQQEQAALESKEHLGNSGAYPGPIVTQIEPATDFFLAEDYHQQYLEKRGQSSCRIPCTTHKRVPYTVCTMVKECRTKRIPYTTCTYTRETCTKRIPYRVCTWTEECITKQVPYVTCSMIRECRTKRVPYTVCTQVKETRTRKVPYTVCRKVCYTKYKTVKRCVPRKVCYTKTRCVPRVICKKVPVKVCCPCPTTCAAPKCGCGE